jgi:hypothetical protein
MGFMMRRERREAEGRVSVRSVMMQFAYDHTVKLWRVTFRPRGDSIPMPRVMHFGDAEKLRELFRRFGSRQLAEDHAALEFAINTNRGAVELTLAETQLRHRRQHRTPTLDTGRGVSRTAYSEERGKRMSEFIPASEEQKAALAQQRFGGLSVVLSH